MKKLTFIICGILLAIAIKAQTPTDNALHAGIDSVVQKAAGVFMSKPGKVGLSVGVIYNDNNYKYNYGETAQGSGKLPSSATLYEIGSITKTFTGLLLTHAIEEKKINLNDDIRKYLQGSYPNLQYMDGRAVKIACVASHIARLPRNTTKAIDNTFTPDDFYNELHAVKLDTLQPYRYTYSNFGYQLLGLLLENAYGMSYTDLVKKYITEPLGMTVTTVYADTSQLIKGYNLQHQPMPYQPAIYPGAGGLRSDIDDMLKYANAQLKATDPAIKMTQQLLYFNPESADAIPWAIGRTRNWDYYIREDGGTRGFRTFITMFPDYGIGVVLLSNETDNDAGRQLYDMTNTIFDGLKNINK